MQGTGYFFDLVKWHQTKDLMASQGLVPPPMDTYETFIARLPIVPIESLPPDERECSICTLPYRSPLGILQGLIGGPSESPLQLPCGHIYGKACLTRWLANHTTCPHCRHQLFDRSSVPEVPRIPVSLLATHRDVASSGARMRPADSFSSVHANWRAMESWYMSAHRPEARRRNALISNLRVRNIARVPRPNQSSDPLHTTQLDIDLSADRSAQRSGPRRRNAMTSNLYRQRASQRPRAMPGNLSDFIRSELTDSDDDLEREPYTSAIWETRARVASSTNHRASDEQGARHRDRVGQPSFSPAGEPLAEPAQWQTIAATRGTERSRETRDDATNGESPDAVRPTRLITGRDEPYRIFTGAVHWLATTTAQRTSGITATSGTERPVTRSSSRGGNISLNPGL